MHLNVIIVSTNCRVPRFEGVAPNRLLLSMMSIDSWHHLTPQYPSFRFIITPQTAEAIN